MSQSLDQAQSVDLSLASQEKLTLIPNQEKAPALASRMQFLGSLSAVPCNMHDDEVSHSSSDGLYFTSIGECNASPGNGTPNSC